MTSKYQEYFAKKHNVKPEDIKIEKLEFNGEDVNVTYKNCAEVKFERLRRITG